MYAPYACGPLGVLNILFPMLWYGCLKIELLV
jgi:hypothetical protein